MTISNIESTDHSTLRVAFPDSHPVNEYEPTKIHLAPEYIFLENIFSPLVEMSNKGEVKPGIAEKFEWQGNDLILHIRENLKTISGIPITAKDVEFSLKRLLVLSGNTHGNFKDLVCGDQVIKSIEDKCDGIVRQDNNIILKAGAKKAFLLPMLTAIDFAIIPQGSCDPKTLALQNYKETTGPYYVESEDGKGNVVLLAKPTHYNFSDKIASKIVLVPTANEPGKNSLDLFAANKVDFITTIDAIRPEDVIQVSEKNSDSVLFSTMNIRSFILVFTERGMKELSAEERFQFGNLIREAFWKAYANTPGYEKSEQFIPSFGEGGLDEKDMAELRALYSKNKVAKFSKNLKIALVRSGSPEKYQQFIGETLPSVKLEESVTVPEFMKYKSIEEMPHASIGGPDSGFLEDIGLISYSLASGIFGMKKPEREKWLDHYMAIPDKENRIKTLKTLHKQALMEPNLIPLVVAPYTALGRKPWNLQLSQMFANTKFWDVKHP